MHVLGRRPGDAASAGDRAPPAARLGRYRAGDGSPGAAVGIDLDRPHAGLVVGKRGSGKSHTLGVIAEGAIDAAGVAPVVLDPMGSLSGLGAAGATVYRNPAVRADALPPARWPGLVGLDPAGPAGTLVWQAATAAGTLSGMCDHVAEADAARVARRGARNHLRLAASWDAFDPAGIDPRDHPRCSGTVLDLSGLAAAPANAVVAAVAGGIHAARTGGDGGDGLPWLFLDEAHVFLDGTAAPALRRILTRGRAPGVSLLAATQRPGALPSVAVSQADLLVAHRLTAEADVSALAAAAPTFLREPLRERLPDERGCAVVVDDATDTASGVRVRKRRTPHAGDSPRASDRR